jgi:hypothetical protein
MWLNRSGSNSIARIKRARRLLEIKKVSFLLLSLGGLTGCARQLYLYPVCFYQAAPKQQRVQDYYSPGLMAGLSTALNDQVRATITPDGRWLVASLTTGQDAKLARIWPRIGCIGNALDSRGTRQEADCVMYLMAFVTTKNYSAFGNAKDVGGFDIWNESPVGDTLVHCHQIKEDEQQQ